MDNHTEIGFNGQPTQEQPNGAIHPPPKASFESDHASQQTDFPPPLYAIAGLTLSSSSSMSASYTPSIDSWVTRMREWSACACTRVSPEFTRGSVLDRRFVQLVMLHTHSCTHRAGMRQPVCGPGLSSSVGLMEWLSLPGMCDPYFERGWRYTFFGWFEGDGSRESLPDSRRERFGQPNRPASGAFTRTLRTKVRICPSAELSKLAVIENIMVFFLGTRL